MAMSLESAVLKQGGTVPKKYTADGPDVSPPLEWTEPPAGTQCFALVCDDPDAPVGTWVHWVLWGLPPETRALPEGLPKTEVLESGACQGRNDFKRIGYGGPSPPRGPAHRYFFRLYALDFKPQLKPGASQADLERVIDGHVLARAELMAKYSR